MQRNQLETAKFVVDSLSALGLKPRPSSRLIKMYEVLAGPTVRIPYGDPNYEIALEARRDMPTLEFILEQGHANGLEIEFIEKLRTVCYDSVLPQSDRHNSKGRDTQFELLVAAICQAATLCPVLYREPDVICTLEGAPIGFAVKRVKSVNQLEKRILEAARQIKRSGRLGCVALETSMALNPENVRIANLRSDDVFQSRYSEAMNQSISEYEPTLDRLRGQEGLIGCIFHDQQVRVDSEQVWGLVGMTTSVCTASNPAEQEAFDSLWNLYRDGLPDVKHL